MLRDTQQGSLVAAIIRMEGSDLPNSVNGYIQRHFKLFNPGHIIWTPWTQAHGATKVTLTMNGGKLRDWGGWPTQAAGEQAILDLLLAYTHLYPGITLQQAVFKYAPPSENNSVIYARNLSAWIGVPGNTPLEQVLTAQQAQQAQQAGQPNPTQEA